MPRLRVAVVKSFRQRDLQSVNYLGWTIEIEETDGRPPRYWWRAKHPAHDSSLGHKGYDKPQLAINAAKTRVRNIIALKRAQEEIDHG